VLQMTDAASAPTSANPASGPLAGAVALVTGASRGIGAAIAAELAAQGALVVGTATSQEGASRIDAALPGASTGAVLDVVDAAACEALVDRVVEQHGRLDILVNNAGITRDSLAMRM